MKKRTITLILILLGAALLKAGPIKMEGYLEGQFGRTYDSEEYKWNMWDPNYYIETKFFSSPIRNAEVFFKIYADNDKGRESYAKSGRAESVFGEGHVQYRYEKYGWGAQSVLFTRESGHYWTDGSMLGIVNTGSVNNDGNGQGVRMDAWYPFGGSVTYVFSDFSSGEGDDIHLVRYRQSLLERVRMGVFYQRKNYPTAAKDDYNEVAAIDVHAGMGRYFLNAEFARSEVPAEEDVEAENDTYSGFGDFFKSNVAGKAELNGIRVGTAKLGYILLQPGVWSYGNTYRNYMGDDKRNEYGFWVNSKYLVSGRAVTLSLNYSQSKNHVPVQIYHTWEDENGYLQQELIDVYNKKQTIYTEMYVEFIKGFKGKIYVENRDEEYYYFDENHFDFFSELSVENRLAKLLTQFKVKDIGEGSEVQLTGVEVSVNLTQDWKFFMRGMIATDELGSRHSIFGEIQYRLSGNTELNLQYGPSWWGQYGLVNDDSFASAGDMKKEVKLILKGWF